MWKLRSSKPTQLLNGADDTLNLYMNPLAKPQSAAVEACSTARPLRNNIKYSFKIYSPPPSHFDLDFTQPSIVFTLCVKT